MEWPPPGRKPPPSLPPSRWQTSNFSSSLFVPGRTCWSWHFLVVWTSPWCPHLSVYLVCCFFSWSLDLLKLHKDCLPKFYHWRELPQVSFLSWQKFCHDKRVCHDKTGLLSQQKYACRDKSFVMTELCLSQQNNCLWLTYCLWQKWTKIVCDKNNNCHDNFFVATKMILVAAPTSDNISVL